VVVVVDLFISKGTIYIVLYTAICKYTSSIFSNYRYN